MHFNITIQEVHEAGSVWAALGFKAYMAGVRTVSLPPVLGIKAGQSWSDAIKENDDRLVAQAREQLEAGAECVLVDGHRPLLCRLVDGELVWDESKAVTLTLPSFEEACAMPRAYVAMAFFINRTCLDYGGDWNAWMQLSDRLMAMARTFTGGLKHIVAEGD